MQNLDVEKDNKTAKIMIGIFAALTVLFVCGGGIVTGIAGAGRESDGVNAAMAMMGPACCSLSGLTAAVIAMFATPGNKTAHIAAPIVAGLAGGCLGGFGISFFFAAIWPSL